MHQHRLEADELEGTLAENFLLDTKLKTSQQCALTVKKAKSIRRNVVSRSNEGVLAPCWVLLSPVRELGLVTLKKRRLRGILSMRINTWRECVQKMQPGSSQRYQMNGQEMVGPNWNTGNSYLNKVFRGKSGQAWDQVAQRGVESPSLKMVFWTMYCIWPCFEPEVGQCKLNYSVINNSIELNKPLLSETSHRKPNYA